MSRWIEIGVVLIFLCFFVRTEDNINQNVVDDKKDDDHDEEGADDVNHDDQTVDNFYSFVVKDSEGNDINLGQYRGKISLVVNVASECGYTDNHYRGLNKLHNHLSTTGRFTVLAFPCNQFGRQEPLPDKEIQEFVKKTYKVKFPVFAKINVIDSDVPDAWQFLSDEVGSPPNWNFFKYLIDENGHVLHSWGPWNSVDEIYSVVQEAVTNAMKLPHTEL